jgi:glycosyltransferase involved in cell wall biosynthesis
MLKIVFLALSVGGAMGDHIDAIAPPLSQLSDLHIFVPEHYSGRLGSAVLHKFKTGVSKKEAFYRLINPLCGFQVWKNISDLKPDLVYIHCGAAYPWAILGVQWAKYKKIPVLLSIHDPEPHPGSLWNTLASYLKIPTMLGATAIHLYSKCFIESVIRQGVTANRIYCIPHGSMAERFVRYKDFDLPRERVALFFGRLEPYKGLDLLLEAGLRLKGDIKIIIAGPGNVPPDISKQIQVNSDIFELHNRYLSEHEVAQLFQRASVCVLPYKQATQSSLPLIAAAFGVPVVATAVGGFVEDVKVVNGILVAPQDPYALVEGIKNAIGRVPTYPKNYEYESLAEKYIDCYTSVISLS